VLALTMSPTPAARRPSMTPAVRLSCHTMALAMGWSVARSHTMVVSRWLAIPTAARSAAVRLARSSASVATPDWLDQISSGSCPTQPERGQCCWYSFWATATTVARSSKTMALELVVPWSSASTWRLPAISRAAGGTLPGYRPMRRRASPLHPAGGVLAGQRVLERVEDRQDRDAAQHRGRGHRTPLGRELVGREVPQTH